MSNNKTGKKRYIEDSPEVREAIADLQAKVSGEVSAEYGDIGTDYTEELPAYEEDLQSQEYVEQDFESGEYEDDYLETYEGPYDESYEEAYEEAYEEDIAGDTFEEVIDETVTKGTIGDVIRESRKQEKERNELNKQERDSRKKKGQTAKTAGGQKKKKKGKAEEEYIISLEGVSKSYIKDVPALDNVNIKIKKGEFVFIVGDSGSGKSTLIKLLLRELKPTEGSILVNGFQVERLRRGKIPKLRRSMGVVFQDFRLLQDRNVYENVAFAQRIIQVPGRLMKRNVPSMLAMVGLAGKYKAKPGELSGGEQQRVALARALVNEPPILLADEPTGNLDVKNTLEIMSLLEKINENGTTVIVVTHNDKIVNDMKKRVITIKKGVIVSDEEKGGYIYED